MYILTCTGGEDSNKDDDDDDSFYDSSEPDSDDEIDSDDYKEYDRKVIMLMFTAMDYDKDVIQIISYMHLRMHGDSALENHEQKIFLQSVNRLFLCIINVNFPKYSRLIIF
jgi:hypothetical protein